MAANSVRVGITAGCTAYTFGGKTHTVSQHQLTLHGHGEIVESMYALHNTLTTVISTAPGPTATRDMYAKNGQPHSLIVSFLIIYAEWKKMYPIKYLPLSISTPAINCHYPRQSPHLVKEQKVRSLGPSLSACRASTPPTS